MVRFCKLFLYYVGKTDRYRLVATLGSKSALKKVTRKAILDVDVPGTCRVILQPEAPMALRLQSSLLWVYLS